MPLPTPAARNSPRVVSAAIPQKSDCSHSQIDLGIPKPLVASMSHLDLERLTALQELAMEQTCRRARLEINAGHILVVSNCASTIAPAEGRAARNDVEECEDEHRSTR